MINITNVKKFCHEDISIIENYDLAVSSDKIWDCHHRNEIMNDGTLHSRKWLIDNNLYYNRPASELIFLTHSEHAKLHGINSTYEKINKMVESNKGKHLSEETKNKISESLKGHKLSEETRNKISKTKRGKHLSDEHKNKLSKANSKEKNGFWGKHHSDEAKQKMREANKKNRYRWMTNGTVTLRVKQNDINTYLSNDYKFGRK